MKLDLHELERKTTSWEPTVNDPDWAPACRRVTLALIARIRDLEAGLGGLVAECEERTENPEGDYYAEQRELLEKGVVTDVGEG